MAKRKTNYFKIKLEGGKQEMSKYDNKIVRNRTSPKNENKYINAYKEMNPSAAKPDGKDIAAVRTKSGVSGHALMKPSDNRSKDRNFHRGEDFIPDTELRKQMKK